MAKKRQTRTAAAAARINAVVELAQHLRWASGALADLATWEGGTADGAARHVADQGLRFNKILPDVTDVDSPATIEALTLLYAVGHALQDGLHIADVMPQDAAPAPRFAEHFSKMSDVLGGRLRLCSARLLALATIDSGTVQDRFTKLHPTAAKVKNAIDRRPGIDGKELARVAQTSEPNVRRIISRDLKTLGYFNPRNGAGYFPPPTDVAPL